MSTTAEVCHEWILKHAIAHRDNWLRHLVSRTIKGEMYADTLACDLQHEGLSAKLYSLHDGYYASGTPLLVAKVFAARETSRYYAIEFWRVSLDSEVTSVKSTLEPGLGPLPPCYDITVRSTGDTSEYLQSVSEAAKTTDAALKSDVDTIVSQFSDTSVSEPDCRLSKRITAEVESVVTKKLRHVQDQFDTPVSSPGPVDDFDRVVEASGSKKTWFSIFQPCRRSIREARRVGVDRIELILEGGVRY